MEREVTDGEGITWTCVQAYAMLSEQSEAQAAARTDSRRESYHVVCTPSGGAKSVRIELPDGWEDSCSDEDLLRAIETGRQGDG